jgi:hypothetical protein
MIEITKYVTKFHVFSPRVEPTLKEVLSAYKSKSFDEESKIWKLSINDYDHFIQDLEEKQLRFTTQVFTPSAVFTFKGESVNMKFNHFCNHFKQIMRISGMMYDQSTQSMIFPREEIKNVIAKLEEFKIKPIGCDDLNVPKVSKTKRFKVNNDQERSL